MRINSAGSTNYPGGPTLPTDRAPSGYERMMLLHRYELP
jgi:hypothetical protein